MPLFDKGKRSRRFDSCRVIFETTCWRKNRLSDKIRSDFVGQMSDVTNFTSSRFSYRRKRCSARLRLDYWIRHSDWSTCTVKNKGVLRNGKKVLAFATSSKPSQTVYYILINHSINLHIYLQNPFFKGLLDVFPIRSLFVSFFEPSRFHFLPFIQSRRTHDGCFVNPNPSVIGDWESMILSRKESRLF